MRPERPDPAICQRTGFFASCILVRRVPENLMVVQNTEGAHGGSKTTFYFQLGYLIRLSHLLPSFLP